MLGKGHNVAAALVKTYFKKKKIFYNLKNSYENY